MHTFVATCATGLEGLTGEEIKQWGGSEIRLGPGSVSWSGPLASGYLACLWSRFASRILLPVASAQVGSDGELYELAREVCWADHFGVGSTFAVDCSLAADAPFSHSKFVALRVKDAVADYFRDREGRRPDVQTTRPDIRLNVHAGDGRVTLALDLSGESLHRRGYRMEAGLAPLKETLAAAIVWLTGFRGQEAFVDPMCGAGTLLIEAALIFCDSAPGLGRTYYGFNGWSSHDPALWSELVSEAAAREELGMEKVWPPFLGYDADPAAVKAARINIRRAGLEEKLQVDFGELHSLQAPPTQGCLVCNPPYGERLAEKETVKYLYRALGNRLKDSYVGWKVGLFTANPDFADMAGLPWDTSYRLYNGALSCRLYTGTVPQQQQPAFSWPSRPLDSLEKGGDFANRLVKNLKKYKTWAAHQGIDCFRVYDRDMPEYNVSIDLYGKWVHIQEFAPPATVDESVAQERFATMLQVVRTVLGVGRDRLFVKTRMRQKGKRQYERKEKSSGRMYEVREGSCALLVNFTDYLDTGLFLDHRLTRQRIGRAAQGKSFLNLFGYTASATVHAALGGAISTTTVDLSNTYQRWAEMNFALNGMSLQRHRLVRADCLEWLKTEQGSYDLIFVDPPTFSNTSKKGRVFDIQRQHRLLLDLAMARLNRAGSLIFSTNYKGFVMDETIYDRFDCRNISAEVVPEDFKRHARRHHCWELRHKLRQDPHPSHDRNET